MNEIFYLYAVFRQCCTNMLKGESKIVACLISGIIIFNGVHAQEWGGEEDRSIWANWAFGVNGGITSYFGDLSIFDSEIIQKFSFESNTALSILFSKSLIPNKLSVTGQLLEGNLKARKNAVSFRSILFEYNLHLRLDVLGLWLNDKPHKFGIVGYGGMGQFFFATNKYLFTEGLTENESYKTGVPEFVFFFGGSVYYKVSPKVSISADLSLHQCRTDRLDNHVRRNNFDYFSFMNAGIAYQVKSLKKPPLRNKARIANTSFQFSN